MDFEKLYSDMVFNWDHARKLLSKDEIKRIAGKNNFLGKLIGVFTPSYWKREKLIEMGEVVIGYAFRSFRFEGESSDVVFPSWVLFSPETKANKNPMILEETSFKLAALSESETLSKEDKKLKAILHNNLGAYRYVKIDEKYTNGSLVYLSIVDVRRDLFPDFKLGYSPLLIGPSISKEVLYLPPGYWTEEWLAANKKGFKE